MNKYMYNFFFSSDNPELESSGVPEPAFKTVSTQTESFEDYLFPMIDLNAEIAKLKSTIGLKHSVENVKDDKTMQMLTGFSKIKFNVIFYFF